MIKIECASGGTTEAEALVAQAKASGLRVKVRSVSPLIELLCRRATLGKPRRLLENLRTPTIKIAYFFPSPNSA